MDGGNLESTRGSSRLLQMLSKAEGRADYCKHGRVGENIPRTTGAAVLAIGAADSIRILAASWPIRGLAARVARRTTTILGLWSPIGESGVKKSGEQVREWREELSPRRTTRFSIGETGRRTYRGYKDKSDKRQEEGK